MVGTKHLTEKAGMTVRVGKTHMESSEVSVCGATMLTDAEKEGL